MVWCGVVWCGVLCCVVLCAGVVWCDVVWTRDARDKQQITEERKGHEKQSAYIITEERKVENRVVGNSIARA